MDRRSGGARSRNAQSAESGLCRRRAVPGRGAAWAGSRRSPKPPRNTSARVAKRLGRAAVPPVHVREPDRPGRALDQPHADHKRVRHRQASSRELVASDRRTASVASGAMASGHTPHHFRAGRGSAGESRRLRTVRQPRHEAPRTDRSRRETPGRSEGEPSLRGERAPVRASIFLLLRESPSADQRRIERALLRSHRLVRSSREPNDGERLGAPLNTPPAHSEPSRYVDGTNRRPVRGRRVGALHRHHGSHGRQISYGPETTCRTVGNTTTG